MRFPVKKNGRFGQVKGEMFRWYYINIAQKKKVLIMPNFLYLGKKGA